MFNLQRHGGYKEQKWKQKPKADGRASATAGAPAATAESVTDRLAGMHIAENSSQTNVLAATTQFGDAEPASQFSVCNPKTVWKPKSYGTVSETTTAAAEAEVTPAKKNTTASIKNLSDIFTVDNSTYSVARVRATFYPKFENEKSDQEVHSFFSFFILFLYYFPTFVHIFVICHANNWRGFCFVFMLYGQMIAF